MCLCTLLTRADLAVNSLQTGLCAAESWCCVAKSQYCTPQLEEYILARIVWHGRSAATNVFSMLGWHDVGASDVFCAFASTTVHLFSDGTNGPLGWGGACSPRLVISLRRILPSSCFIYTFRMSLLFHRRALRLHRRALRLQHGIRTHQLRVNLCAAARCRLVVARLGMLQHACTVLQQPLPAE